jgi:hypothetical protein
MGLEAVNKLLRGMNFEVFNIKSKPPKNWQELPTTCLSCGNEVERDATGMWQPRWVYAKPKGRDFFAKELFALHKKCLQKL